MAQELGVDQVEIRCGAAGEVAGRDWYNNIHSKNNNILTLLFI